MVFLRNQVLWCIAGCLWSYSVKAQTIKSVIDRNDIRIGEQIKLNVIAGFSADMQGVEWLSIPDTLQHFEIIERSKIDTLFTRDSSRQFEQTITFTSFDSGRWNFPAFSVKATGPDNLHGYHLQTDSFTINIRYAVPDSTNQLKDIKPIMDVSVKDYFWYYFAVGVLLVLLIAFFIIWFLIANRLKHVKNNGKGLSPYDQAMEDIQTLKELDLRNAESIKKYHSNISRIFKRYLSHKLHKNLLNCTTDDILMEFSGQGLLNENIAPVAIAMRTGDAAKFAKYLPQPGESESCCEKIKEMITQIETTKPLNP
jgi:hypothetical protein